MKILSAFLCIFSCLSNAFLQASEAQEDIQFKFQNDPYAPATLSLTFKGEKGTSETFDQYEDPASHARRLMLDKILNDLHYEAAERRGYLTKEQKNEKLTEIEERHALHTQSSRNVNSSAETELRKALVDLKYIHEHLEKSTLENIIEKKNLLPDGSLFASAIQADKILGSFLDQKDFPPQTTNLNQVLVSYGQLYLSDLMSKIKRGASYQYWGRKPRDPASKMVITLENGQETYYTPPEIFSLILNFVSQGEPIGELSSQKYRRVSKSWNEGINLYFNTSLQSSMRSNTSLLKQKLLLYPDVWRKAFQEKNINAFLRDNFLDDQSYKDPTKRSLLLKNFQDIPYLFLQHETLKNILFLTDDGLTLLLNDEMFHDPALVDELTTLGNSEKLSLFVNNLANWLQTHKKLSETFEKFITSPETKSLSQEYRAYLRGVSLLEKMRQNKRQEVNSLLSEKYQTTLKEEFKKEETKELLKNDSALLSLISCFRKPSENMERLFTEPALSFFLPYESLKQKIPTASLSSSDPSSKEMEKAVLLYDVQKELVASPDAEMVSQLQTSLEALKDIPPSLQSVYLDLLQKQRKANTWNKNFVDLLEGLEKSGKSEEASFLLAYELSSGNVSFIEYCYPRKNNVSPEKLPFISSVFAQYYSTIAYKNPQPDQEALGKAAYYFLHTGNVDKALYYAHKIQKRSIQPASFLTALFYKAYVLSALENQQDALNTFQLLYESAQNHAQWSGDFPFFGRATASEIRDVFVAGNKRTEYFNKYKQDAQGFSIIKKAIISWKNK